MFKASVIADNDVLDAIADALPKAPILMQVAMTLNVRQVDDEIISKLRVVPPPPKYPFQFASAKSRRAFFATNGFGRGIPTRRTNEMVNNWETVYLRTPTGGEVSVENPTSYTRFVQGIHQQPGHIETGWIYAPDVIVEADIRLNDLLIETWYAVSEQIVLGGTR